MKKKGDEVPEVKRTGSYCHHCANATSFYLYRVEEYERLGEVNGYFHFATCDLCNGPAVFLRVDSDEDPEPEFSRLFPESKNALSCELPEEVARSYREVIACEESAVPLACAVMVGRTLEAVCREHFASEKSMSIFNGIRKLYEEGIVSEQLKEWADELRVLRNIGAHAVGEDISVADARESVSFLRAILENLYDLRPRFEQFKARRASSDGDRD